MENLFRFMSVRAPQAQSVSTIDLTTQSDYQSELVSLAGGGVAAFPNMVEFTTSWMNGNLVKGSVDLHLGAKLDALRAKLDPIPPTITRASLEAAISTIFGSSSATVAASADFTNDRVRLYQSIVAVFIAPRAPAAKGVSLLALASIAQTMHLVEIVADPSQAITAASVAEALAASLVMPPAVFPLGNNEIKPIGMADLLVVKQRIKRYELGELQRIESLLQGETRKLAEKHTLTTSQTTTTSQSTTTETDTELTTDERFALQRQAQTTIQEDINAKGSVSVTAKYGDAVTVNANVSASYSNSKTSSSSSSTDYAKDVTQRAATKVTQTISQTVTTTVTEMLEQDESRSLDNGKGDANVIGLYQWVNAVYEAQVFNYGQRLLFDLVVPEPAALLLAAANNSTIQQAPAPPLEFKLTPAQIGAAVTTPTDANYYGNFLNMYDVEGLTPYPTDQITVAKTFAVTGDDKTYNKNAEVTIPAGYKATTAIVLGEYNTQDSDSGINVYVGNASYQIKNQVGPSSNKLDLNSEAQAIAVGIETWKVSDYAITIEVTCEPTPDTKSAWILATHSKILAAWQKKVQDYQDAIAKQTFQSGGQSPLGSENPEENRLIEQRELKRSLIQMMWTGDFKGLTAITEDPAPTPKPGDPPAPPFQSFPRPAANAMATGRLVRFFEQAFEWENLSYVCYPYFWGRPSTWYGKVLQQNVDPIFESFLNAGAARVVLPVRPNFEADVRYYVMTGQVWSGADLPAITDEDYLPITEEIKAITGAPEGEKPQGVAWEITLPTTLIKLRADGKLPGWDRKPPAPLAEVDGWVWVADPPDA